MKKLFNNYGVTLIEVVAAAVILVIIGAAILNTLLQTAKFNVSSEVEMRMKAETEKVVEGIKANRGATTVGGLDYSAGVYYDKLFINQVSSSDPKAYYHFTATKDNTTVNSIDTSDNYDRWDFKIGIKKADNTNSQVYVYNNKETPVSLYSTGSLHGKLWDENELTSGFSVLGANMKLDFQGTVDASTKPYRFVYTIGGASGPSSPVSFMPGLNRGAIDTSNSNTIVVNIFRTDDKIDDPLFDFSTLPKFNIDISNSTFYNGSISSFYTIPNPLDSSKQILGYWKNIIVNIYGDSDDPTKSTISITPKSPYITVNRSRGSLPSIKNGYKINVTISEKSTNKAVKVFPSVVE